MTNDRQFSRLLRGGLLLMAILFWSCASATGPDGSDDVPQTGASFMQVVYYLNGAGDVVDTLRPPKFDSIKTTIIPTIFPAPLGPPGVGFADSLIRNGVPILDKGAQYLRYYANGDVGIYAKASQLNFKDTIVRSGTTQTSFRGNAIAVGDTFLVMPFGGKRDYSYTFLDSTLTQTAGGGETQMTRYTVVDSVSFGGPELHVAPNAIVPFAGAAVVETMQAKIYRLTTIVSTLAGQTVTLRTQHTLTIGYAPKYGAVLYVHDYTHNVGGIGRTVIVSSLP